MNPLGGNPEGKGVQEDWTVFKNEILKLQQQAVLQLEDDHKWYSLGPVLLNIFMYVDVEIEGK